MEHCENHHQEKNMGHNSDSTENKMSLGKFYKEVC